MAEERVRWYALQLSLTAPSLLAKPYSYESLRYDPAPPPRAPQISNRTSPPTLRIPRDHRFRIAPQPLHGHRVRPPLDIPKALTSPAPTISNSITTPQPIRARPLPLRLASRRSRPRHRPRNLHRLFPPPGPLALQTLLLLPYLFRPRRPSIPIKQHAPPRPHLRTSHLLPLDQHPRSKQHR